MNIRLSWRNRNYKIDYDKGRSLAIPLDPHGEQPSFFVDQPASATPLKSGDYIGDVSAGGSCNAEVISFVPHCHGTHTECIGHISEQRITVQESIYQHPCIAQLITLQADSGSRKISAEAIAEHLDPDAQALIVRTLPNDAQKMSRNYSDEPDYAVFSSSAMEFLGNSNLLHLLLDTPSLDKADDGGKLSNHRTWWGLGRTHLTIQMDKRSVTELIYVANDIADGLYWLHLELSPLMSDATPSRPMIYPLGEEQQ